MAFPKEENIANTLEEQLQQMNNSHSPIHTNEQYRSFKDRQEASAGKLSGDKNQRPQDRSMTYSGNQSRFEQATNMVKIDKPTDFQNQSQGRFEEEPMKVRQLEEQIASLKSIIEEKELLIE